MSYERTQTIMDKWSKVEFEIAKPKLKEMKKQLDEFFTDLHVFWNNYTYNSPSIGVYDKEGREYGYSSLMNRIADAVLAEIVEKVKDSEVELFVKKNGNPNA